MLLLLFGDPLGAGDTPPPIFDTASSGTALLPFSSSTMMPGPTSIPGPTRLYTSSASTTTLGVGVGFDTTLGGSTMGFSGESDFTGEEEEEEEDFGEGEWDRFSGVEGSGRRDISGDLDLGGEAPMRMLERDFALEFVIGFKSGAEGDDVRPMMEGGVIFGMGGRGGPLPPPPPAPALLLLGAERAGAEAPFSTPLLARGRGLGMGTPAPPPGAGFSSSPGFFSAA